MNSVSRGFLKFCGIVFVAVIIALGVIQFQEDAEDCRRGGHNAQCPLAPVQDLNP